MQDSPTSPDGTPRGVVAVTGGGRGIGAAVCRRLGRDGRTVLVGYLRDREAAEQVAVDVRAAGGRAEAVAVDVRDEGSVEAFVAAALALGPLTGLVANAGAARAVGALVDNDLDDIRRDVEVNLVGVIATVRAGLAAMGEGGAVVTLSSASATLGAAGRYVHYAAAKAGVEAFTVGVAREAAERGVRVNAVAPGTTWTDFHVEPDRPAQVAPTVPLGRAGDADEIAAAVVWLLGEDASYTTGAVLRVAGGL
ncbi:SDR family oxidoreductase [Nocardioides zeae]|uniref:SDR family oxidoreductase n=1 Tax=Nocardioides imazamoxiresistens TaxID=3231893 RepID=A0ABU3PYF7_9ACTN|nr:SDR family oxidoreductase [Nocardioides zeae]MDT9594283.1 SDR family oxidoreductase [Nocardioides zeae]